MISAPAGVGLGGRRLLLTLIVWILASAAAVGVTVVALRVLAPASADDPKALGPLIVFEVYALLIAVMAIVLRPTFREVVAAKRCSALDVAVTAATCAAAYGVVGGLDALFAPGQWRATVALLRAIGSDDGRLASAGPVLAGVILARACLLAPIGEELLFRGALYTWLRRRLSARLTVTMTAAAFAAIHGYPGLLPLAFVIGLGFGVIRERSGSTVPLIIVHAVNNVVLTVLSFEATGWTARLPQWGT